MLLFLDVLTLKLRIIIITLPTDRPTDPKKVQSWIRGNSWQLNSLLNMMENAFCFNLEALFVLQIFFFKNHAEEKGREASSRPLFVF